MPPLPHPPLPRIITYYQTHHDKDGKPISVLPLLTQPHVGITHVILAALHINHDPAAMTLNDHHPKDPRFTTLWAEMRVLQASGVKVLLMLGGAAKGSYERLDSDDATFERYYLPLRDLVRERALDGTDLDVEEEMTLGGIIRLIDRIRADFGPDFLITMAPVAAALLDAQKNMSGFDYEALEVMRGKDIAWYNTQFYCGWGDCSNPVMYEMIMYKGWKPEKVVVGLLTSPANGHGYVPWEALTNVLPLLHGRHARFGGVMGWEYFNSLPGGKERPWEWAQWMTKMLKGQRTESQEIVAPSGNTVALPATEKAPEMRNSREDDGEAPIPQSFEYYSDGNASD